MQPPTVRPIRVLAACLAIAVVGSCAETPADSGDDGVAQRFGACDLDGELGFAPAPDYLGNVQRWLEVTEPSSEFEDQGLIDAGGTATIDMMVDQLEAIDVGRGSQKEPVAIHVSMLPGMRWAFDNGGRVFLAMGEGFEREIVLYTMIRPSRADSFFAGECQFEALTSPVRQLLGEASKATLDKLVGMTDPNEIERLIAGPPPASPSPVVILNPADSDPELLASLDHVSLVFARPDEWSGPYVMCTRIDAGWNDCFDLALPNEPPPVIGAYLDDSLTLEIWLLDASGDLRAPIEMLGTVSLVSFDSVVKAEGEGVLRLELSGKFISRSPTPVVGPSVEAVDGASWTQLFDDPVRYAEVTGDEIVAAGETDPSVGGTTGPS